MARVRLPNSRRHAHRTSQAMSDNAIRVGDLVRVARGMPCCGHPTGAEGMIFAVRSIEHTYGEYCDFCNRLDPEDVANGCAGRLGIDLSRLRKIPDLWELDEAERKESLSA